MSFLRWFGRSRRLEEKLDQILKNQEILMADLSKLQAAVAANTSAEGSAIALIQGLADEIKKANGDQAAVDALADQISAQASALSAAVVANTPAAPTL